MSCPSPLQTNAALNHRRKSSGYALLLVLVVLALAGTLLALIARRSASKARDTLLVERATQTRWGLASCESLLTHAQELLVEADDAGHGRPVAERMYRFQLGAHQATVVLADEQAKPNLNVLASKLNATQMTDLLHRRAEGAEVALWPLAGDRPFVCWEQLFPRSPMTGANDVPSAANRFTIWGDGKFRVLTASPQACEDFFGTDLSSDQIAQLRVNIKGGMAVADAAALLPKESRGIGDRLTDDCKAHSAWITLEGAGIGAPERKLIVVTPEEKTSVRRFCWP